MESKALLFVLSTLTTFGVWWVLAEASLLDPWREALYNRWPPDSKRRATVGVWIKDRREVEQSARIDGQRLPDVSMWAKGLSCPWCAGFYLSGAMTLLLILTTGVVWPLLWWPATWVGVGLIGSR